MKNVANLIAILGALASIVWIAITLIVFSASLLQFSFYEEEAAELLAYLLVGLCFAIVPYCLAAAIGAYGKGYHAMVADVSGLYKSTRQRAGSQSDTNSQD